MNKSALREEIISRVKRVVIKVGSAVLTTDEGLDLRVINRLADEVSLLLERGLQVVMVSSGAIAAGVRKMKLADTPKSIPQKQAYAAIGQSILMQVYEEAFHRYGVEVAQVLLTGDDLSNRHRYLNARNTIFTLMQWRVIPIINENDTVVVKEIRLGDNDNLAAMVVNLIDADLLINLTSIDGLYDQDPRQHPEAKFIPLVESITRKIEKYATDVAYGPGRGGMLSKLQAARKAALGGVPTIIVGGKQKNNLSDVFDGVEVGTLVLPVDKPISKRRSWIAFSCSPAGDIVVDDGAKDVLLHNGKSLLPSGITKVEGRFGPGSVVRCVDGRGEMVAVGLVNYASTEIERIKGLKTSQIEESLGYKPYDEVIHRDNMVIFHDGGVRCQ
ncbi:MAG: glutamate 5-kinase [Deltaproteobacteria bacterium]|nr:glutamate 5-kinase [Deltaproteobacteria bacterium]